jgi:hypothetical protein
MNFLNVIVDNGNVWESDKEILFGDEEVLVISPDVSIFDLLITLGSFTSKSQARKNWKHGREIPLGWSEFWIGKVKRQLCIWNPQPFDILNLESFGEHDE